MSDASLVVQSHVGQYEVTFGDAARAAIATPVSANTHVLVDTRVAALHAELLAPLLAMPSVLRIDATEENKSLERMPAYVQALLVSRVRRGHRLFCVGGGILQDITCFLAATLLRGLEWQFVPTTLLAQADSCIGSKSSINVGSAKNVVGTYTPPSAIYVWPAFLETLDERDVRSGIGEMLKVHAIAGPDAFADITRDYERIVCNRGTQLRYIRKSLEIKKALIELDEFDRGPRLVLNYGHSFGHAIEAATNFAIPHGIAITIGMDLANFVASRLDPSVRVRYDGMHGTLRRNYAGFERHPIEANAVLAALAKDKKNSDTALRLVLPDAQGRIALTSQVVDERLTDAVTDYLRTERLA